MDKQILLADFKEATDQLLKTIDDVPEQHFNTAPTKGGWSSGQIAEHLIKVEVGAIRLFSGPTAKADRDPEQKIEEIENRFLDFDSKMTASRPIVPDDKPKNKDKALQKLQDLRQRQISTIEIQDLTKLVTGFGHPIFDKLTKIEWLVFNMCHGKRHAHQIRQIMNQL